MLGRLPAHHAAVARLLGATAHARGGAQAGRRFLARWRQKRAMPEADAHWNATKAPLLRGVRQVLDDEEEARFATGRALLRGGGG